MERLPCLHFLSCQCKAMYSSLSLQCVICVCAVQFCRKRLLNLHRSALGFLSQCLRFIFPFFPFFLLNRRALLSNLLFLKPALKCAPSRTFCSHIGIRWVETFSGAVRFSSSELPLQSQSLKVSIIRREWRGGGRKARKEGVLGSVCITVAKLLRLLNHRISLLQTSPGTPPLVCSAGFWVTCKKGEK